MKERLKEGKGITLIALVITIIVLLILAGVVIQMLTGDNGILKQAVTAKEKTDKKSVKEKLQLAVTAAFSNVNHKMNEKSLEDELKKAFDENTKLISDKRNGYIVQSGEKVIGVIDENGRVGEGIWHYSPEEGEDLIITDGKNKLEIGDEINYDCTKDGNGKEIIESYTANAGYEETTFYANKYTGRWGVLGAENGKILIMPLKESVGGLSICSTSGYRVGQSELNKISEIYGHGKGAVGARSLKIEDVNKVTGYNPNNVGVRDLSQKGIGTKYEEGELLREYGKRIICERKNGNIYYNGIKASDSRFWFYNDEGNWVSLKEGESMSFITTKYEYYIDTLTNVQNSLPIVGIERNSKAWKLLSYSFILASTYLECTNDNYMGYSIRIIHGGRVFGGCMAVSAGVGHVSGGGVAPVITLDAEIQLKKEGEVWKIQ